MTYAAASRNGNLDRVSSRLADVFEIERLMGGFVLATVNAEWGCINRNLNAGWPVGVHGPILMVEAFEL